jgi:carboxypeptidase PM20D1
MKKIILGLILLLVLLATILLFNTFQLNSKQVAAEPSGKIPISDEVFQNLSKAIQYQTISYSEDAIPDSAAFLGFHRFLEETFPLTHANLTLEKISDYSLIYKWEGTDSSKKPIILMSHQDVVPVDEPTLGDWEAAPFEGKITETHIIGRGTLDDKGTLVATLEAVERLLEESFVPSRTLYLTFGHDEEVGGANGAVKIAAYLKEKGVQAAMTIDEGGFIAENMIPGVEKPIAIVNLAEKGFASFRLIVETNGGEPPFPLPRPALQCILRLR